MTLPAKLAIAVIGKKDQVDLLRLAGISHFRILEGDRQGKEDFLETLAGLLGDPTIGVIMFPRHARPFLQGFVTAGAGLTPVLVELPDPDLVEDVGALYRDYARKLLGIAVEL